MCPYENDDVIIDSISDYWDSFWILEGLFQSQLYTTINDTLQNFMDELDTIGFIPNGGRIYYLDRSQPPLFTRVRRSQLFRKPANKMRL